MSVRTPFVLILAGGLLFVACGGGHVDQLIGRPEPAEPATGPVVLAMDVGETAFRLHDEGDGCLAVAIHQAGLQSTVERSCFDGERVLAATTECGWLAQPSAENSGCDVPLPRVMFGQVRVPAIRFVCVGTIEESGEESTAVSARFVPIDPSGFILSAAPRNEVAVPHVFTSGGLRYGQAPLDEPSRPIYRLCEAEAPWGTPEAEYQVALRVEMDAVLIRDDVTVIIDAGLGEVGISGSAAVEGELISVPMRVPASSPGLEISIETEGEEEARYQLHWPEAFQEILEAIRVCDATDGRTSLRLSIEQDALTGTEDAIELVPFSSLCDP
jgi:hypothetical protein